MRINQWGENSRSLLETLILGHRIFSVAVRLRKKKRTYSLRKKLPACDKRPLASHKRTHPIALSAHVHADFSPLRIKLHYRTAHESSPHKIPVGAPSLWVWPHLENMHQDLVFPSSFIAYSIIFRAPRPDAMCCFPAAARTWCRKKQPTHWNQMCWNIGSCY